jgi:hypothetical protein
MNSPLSFIAIIVALLVPTSANCQETIKPLEGELTTLAIITGFHQALDKQNGFEVRLLEVDASATVAMNPVALYVVITNSSSATDLQQHVWLLPHKVSKVQGVELSPPILRIRAEIDADPRDSSKRMGKVLSVRYTISDGALSDTLSMNEELIR